MIKEVGGRILVDGFLETTQPAQFDKYLNFVTVSTPTLTPASGHTLLFANSAANQFIAKFSDGTTTVLGGSTSGGGTITAVVAGTDLTGGGVSGSVTLNVDETKVLTTSSATATYLTLSSATVTYLPKSSATATYLSITNAAATYCTSAGGATCPSTSGVTAGSTTTFTGINVFTSSITAKGTSTNDNAPAGYVGEYISSTTAASKSYPATGQYGDLLSITITAGDWQLSAIVCQSPNGATVNVSQMGISLTSGNSSAGLVEGDNFLEGRAPTTSNDECLTLPGYRVSISAGNTYILKYRANYTVAIPKASAKIAALRIR